MATKPSTLDSTSSLVIEPWNVILLNDDWHTFDEVISQVVKATGCSVEQARAIAWSVHMNGEAVCFTGSRERCELVANVLEEIELGVRLEAA